MAESTELRDAVRERYASAAKGATSESGCCGGSACGGELGEADATTAFGAALYDGDARQQVGTALELSLGCGNPTAVAELHEREVVLDLGSGAGGDVLLSARRVGATGRVYGLDMTEEMLELARENARSAGVANVQFLKGYIEEVPLPDDAVDVVISNCVINLSADKQAVIAEAARVLRPGGRLAVTDVIADEDMDEGTRHDMQQWTGCIAGALTEAEFTHLLERAGFEDIEIRETHRVHEHAGSAIVRARRPGA
jgi:ubiquinone/menaquinone biosynthesis C-methylase UbiE